MLQRIKLGDRLAIALLFMYAALSLNGPYVNLILYISIPGSAFLSWCCSNDKTMLYSMRHLSLLFVWIGITAAIAYNPDVSFIWLRRIVAVYLLCLATQQLAKKSNLIPWFYLVWVVMYIVSLIYVRTQLLLNQIDYTSQRLYTDQLNANTLGYYTFFFTYIVYYLGEFYTKNYLRFVFKILFFLTIPLSFYIAIITASRQILIVQAPLIFSLLYIRYIKGSSTFKRVFFVILSVVSIVVLLPKAIETFDSSLLSQRLQMDLDDDARTTHIKNGIATGLENPLTGVGVGCYGIYNYGTNTFAHNTFVELFATTGFIGVFIFVYMLYKFVKFQYVRYKKYKDLQFLMFFLVGLIYILDNMFYVFHVDPWLMAFFILLSTHAEIYYREKYRRTY